MQKVHKLHVVNDSNVIVGNGYNNPLSLRNYTQLHDFARHLRHVRRLIAVLYIGAKQELRQINNHARSKSCQLHHCAEFMMDVGRQGEVGRALPHVVRCQPASIIDDYIYRQMRALVTFSPKVG